MPCVADTLASALHRAGIHTAFGIPGGETLTLLEALRSVGIRFVLARHETGAGLLAEGLHHADGSPGLLVATVGPGVANCPNAVAQALLDRVPLVVVTGNVADHHGNAFTHQVFDQLALLAPLVKASFRLRPETAARDIVEGLRVMTEGRPGPVHFDVPLDVAEAPCGPLPAAGTVGAPALPDLTGVAERLRGAARPLVVVGLEALGAPVPGLVQRLGAPVIGTYKAIGVLGRDHPQWVSAAGLSPRADDVLLPLVRRADVVVLAGYDAIEMRAGWLEPFDPDAFVIDVSVCPRAPREHRTDVRLVGPVDDSLGALRDRLGEPPDRPEWATEWATEWQTARQAVASAFPETDDWGPAGVIGAVQRSVDHDTFVTVDTGAHRILTSQRWQSARPGRLLQSTGLCTMGYAVPVAIGAALGSGRRAVAVVGDGGFEMALGELATARDLGVDVTVVVIDDRSLALIEKKQRARGLPNLGVDFGPSGTDHVALARAIGAEAERFDDTASLAAFLSRPGPGLRLAHCPIDRRAYDTAI